jgi:hypothetical protein
MPFWLILVLVFAGPILIGMGLGVVLAWKLTRFKIPAAVTHLHAGKGQALLITYKGELSPEELANARTYLLAVLARAGVALPVLVSDSRMEYAIVGDRLADSHQKVPA